MEIDNFLKQQGLFLKATDHVEPSPTKVFVPTAEADVVENTKFGGERLHIGGQMDELDFVFDCSKTNARTIAEVLGSDTKKWIGAKITLETYKTKTSDGKMVNAINVAKVSTGDKIPEETVKVE